MSLPASPDALKPLTNSLITSEQLQAAYQHYTKSAISKAQFGVAVLTQAAGVLLRLPEEVIARAIILLQRYTILHNPILESQNGGASAARDLSASTVYLTAKISFTPLSPRSVINVYAYLKAQPSLLGIEDPSLRDLQNSVPDPKTYFVSEGEYEIKKQTLFANEMRILAGLGFDTYVALPHQTALTYILALIGASPLHDALALRTIEHLNALLLSPQLVYLTHQPPALAVAAIYLSARALSIKLPEMNWWEVFDVEREELGFLMLVMSSLANYVEEYMNQMKLG